MMKQKQLFLIIVSAFILVPFTGISQTNNDAISAYNEGAQLIKSDPTGAIEAFNIINKIGGILIPAHVFTPHKSVYGKCIRKIREMFTASSLNPSSKHFTADDAEELRDREIGRFNHSIIQLLNLSIKHSLNHSTHTKKRFVQQSPRGFRIKA